MLKPRPAWKLCLQPPTSGPLFQPHVRNLSWVNLFGRFAVDAPHENTLADELVHRRGGSQYTLPSLTEKPGLGSTYAIRNELEWIETKIPKHLERRVLSISLSIYLRLLDPFSNATLRNCLLVILLKELTAFAWPNF